MRSLPVLLALAAIHVAHSAPVHHPDRKRLTDHTPERHGRLQRAHKVQHPHEQRRGSQRGHKTHHAKRLSDTVRVCVNVTLHTVTCPGNGCDGRLVDVNKNDPLLLVLGGDCPIVNRLFNVLGSLAPVTETHLSGSIGAGLLSSLFNPSGNNGQAQSENQDPGSTQNLPFNTGAPGNQDPGNSPNPPFTTGAFGNQGSNSGLGQSPNTGFNGNQAPDGNGIPVGGGSVFGGNTGPTFLGLPGLDVLGNPVSDGGDATTGILSGLMGSIHLGGPSPSPSSTSQAPGNIAGNGNGNGNRIVSGDPVPTNGQPDGSLGFTGNQGVNSNPDPNGNGIQGDGPQPIVDGEHSSPNDGLIGGDDGGLFGGNTGPTFLGFPGPEVSPSRHDDGTGVTVSISTSLLGHGHSATSGTASPSQISGTGVGFGRGNSDSNGDVSPPSDRGDVEPFDPSDSQPALEGQFPQGSLDGPGDPLQGGPSSPDPQPAGSDDSPPDGSPGDLGPGPPPPNNGSPSFGDDHPDPDHPFNDGMSSGEDLPLDDSQLGHDHSDHPGDDPLASDDSPDHHSAGGSLLGDEHLEDSHDNDTQFGDARPHHSHGDVDDHPDHSFSDESQFEDDHQDHHPDPRDQDPHSSDNLGHLRKSEPQFGDHDSGRPFDDGSRLGGDHPDPLRDDSQFGHDQADHFRTGHSHSDDDRSHHPSHDGSEFSESHSGHFFIGDSQLGGDHSHGHPFKDRPQFTDSEPNVHPFDNGLHFGDGIPGGHRFDHSTHFDDGIQSHDPPFDDGPRSGEDPSHNDPQDESPHDDHPLYSSRFTHHQHRPNPPFGHDSFDNPQSSGLQGDIESPSDLELPPRRPIHSRPSNVSPNSHLHEAPENENGNPDHVRVQPEFFGPGPVKLTPHFHGDPTWPEDEQVPHSHVFYDASHLHRPYCPCKCS